MVQWLPVCFYLTSKKSFRVWFHSVYVKLTYVCMGNKRHSYHWDVFVDLRWIYHRAWAVFAWSSRGSRWHDSIVCISDSLRHSRVKIICVSHARFLWRVCFRLFYLECWRKFCQLFFAWMKLERRCAKFSKKVNSTLTLEESVKYIYEIIHICTAAVDESEVWSSQ